MKKSHLLLGAVIAGLVLPESAHAAGSGMPWEGPLKQILTSRSRVVLGDPSSIGGYLLRELLEFLNVKRLAVSSPGGRG